VYFLKKIVRYLFVVLVTALAPGEHLRRVDARTMTKLRWIQCFGSACIMWGFGSGFGSVSRLKVNTFFSKVNEMLCFQ
jgi:hypothetical protein